mgnify:CR=1 FL=1
MNDYDDETGDEWEPDEERLGMIDIDNCGRVEIRDESVNNSYSSFAFKGILMHLLSKGDEAHNMRHVMTTPYPDLMGIIDDLDEVKKMREMCGETVDIHQEIRVCSVHISVWAVAMRRNLRDRPRDAVTPFALDLTV